MHYNYKSDERTIINIIKRPIKPIEKQKQIKLIIYKTKFKISNLIVKINTNSAKILLNQTNVVYKFISPFREFLPKNKNNSYISNSTTMLSRRLTYHLSENSAIKHQIIKHNNNTNQLTSSDVGLVGWLVGWMVEFYGISTFVGYLTPNPFLCK